MDPRRHEFAFGTLQYEDGLFIVRLYEDSEFEIETIRTYMAKCVEMSGGERFCMLIDANKNAKVSPETRAWAAKSEHNRYIIARAVITHSLAMKMAINFFIRFNKPMAETRMFTDENEARLWLAKKRQAAGSR